MLVRNIRKNSAWPVCLPNYGTLDADSLAYFRYRTCVKRPIVEAFGRADRSVPHSYSWAFHAEGTGVRRKRHNLGKLLALRWSLTSL